MTLTELRYLIALAKEMHFGRAAERCHVSQPTLSVAIKKFENQLGAVLFERSASELRLTELGGRIVQQAKRVVAEAVRLEEIAAEDDDPLKGLLRIGVIYTVAPYLLPQFVPALHRSAPGMPLYLKEDFTANLLAAVKAGELDAAILALPVVVPGLVAQSLYDEPFRVVVPLDHPLTAPIATNDLASGEVMILGRGNCFRDQVLEACPHLAAPGGLERSVEGGSLETLRYMVASGAGIAVMPSTAADPLLDRESLVRVLAFSGPQPMRRIALVWRASFPRTRAMDVVKFAVLSCALPGTSKL